MQNTNWSFNEFLAFLLIYAAHADIEFSNEEKEFIKDIVSKEIFDSICNEFNQLTDFQALDLILNYKDLYCSTQKEKKYLFEKLNDLFHVDGEFTQLEKELLVFLDRLL